MTESNKSPWPTGLYVLLDPETGKPQEYEGNYALQSNGNTFCDGLAFDQAQYISRAVNSHAALVEALEGMLSAGLYDDSGDYVIECESNDGTADDTQVPAITKARAALTLAKGA